MKKLFYVILGVIMVLVILFVARKVRADDVTGIEINPWAIISGILQPRVATNTQVTNLTVTGTCTGCGGAGSGITTLNGQTGVTQTFSTNTTATGLSLNITSSTNNHDWALALQSGYNIPLTASTTNWNNFYDTPSTRITAGTGLSWSGNTLNATGGSGNSAFTIGNGFVYNATSTDLVGIGSSTPIGTLSVLGKATTVPFVVASSTNARLFQIGQDGVAVLGGTYNGALSGGLSINTAAGPGISLQTGDGAGNYLSSWGRAWDGVGYVTQFGANTGFMFSVNRGNYGNTGGGTNSLYLASSGNVGINSTTPAATLTVKSYAGITPLLINSSTGTTLLSVGTNGSTTISSLGAGCVNSTATGGLFVASCATGGSGNSAWTIGSGLVYNATSTDLVGIGTITPTTTLFIQGKAGVNPFTIASSTGATQLQVTQAGAFEIYGTASTTQPVFGVYPNTTTSNILAVGTATTTILSVLDGGYVGIGTTTPTQPLVVVGSSTITSLGSGCVNSTATGGLFVAPCAAGGSGNSAWTIGNGLIYHATSTDLVGIGTITPTSSLFIQGKAGTNPFTIASSSNGTTLFDVSQYGTTTTWGLSVKNTTGASGNTQGLVDIYKASSGANDILFSVGSNQQTSRFSIPATGAIALGSATAGNLRIASNDSDQIHHANSTSQYIDWNNSNNMILNAGLGDILMRPYGTEAMRFTTSGRVGVGTTSPVATFAVTGIASSTLNAFVVASSTNSVMFQIAPNGSTTIANLTASNCDVKSTTAGLLFCGTDATAAGGGATTTITSNIASNGPDFTFATSSATGLDFQIVGSGATLTFAPVLQSGYVIPQQTTLDTYSTYAYGSSTYVNFTYASTTFPNVTLAGQNYLSISGQQITANLIDVTSHITGVVPVANGGTGTSTAPTVQGQILMADVTGTKYRPGNLVAGSNITITTTTPGQITIAATDQYQGTVTGTGSGGVVPYWTSASALTSSILYANASVAGVGATSTSYNFYIQTDSTGSPDGFAVNNNTNGTVFHVGKNARIGVNTTTPIAILAVKGLTSVDPFVVASSSGAVYLTVSASAQILACTTCRLTIPQGTSPTLSAAGDIAHDTTADQLLYGSQPNVLVATSTKTLTVTAPSGVLDIPGPFFDRPITITKVTCMVKSTSTSTPSFTFGFYHGTSGATTSAATLFSTSQTCNSTTTPTVYNSFGDNTLGAGEILTASTSSISLASSTTWTIHYKYDRE